MRFLYQWSNILQSEHWVTVAVERNKMMWKQHSCIQGRHLYIELWRTKAKWPSVQASEECSQPKASTRSWTKCLLRRASCRLKLTPALKQQMDIHPYLWQSVSSEINLEFLKREEVKKSFGNLISDADPQHLIIYWPQRSWEFLLNTVSL